MISRRIAVGAVSLTAAAAAAVLGATSAYAAVSSVTISAPGVASGTSVAVTGTASGNLVLKSLRTTSPPGATVTCTSTSNPSTASGTTTTGTFTGSTAGTNRAQISSATFRNCITAGSVSVTNNPLPSSWILDVTNPTASGSTPGNLRNISIELVAGTCRFTVGGPSGAQYGSVTGSYVNGSTPKIVVDTKTASTTQLFVRSFVSTASNGLCLAGAIQVGDPLSFSGTYNIDAKVGGVAKNPLSVTAS